MRKTLRPLIVLLLIAVIPLPGALAASSTPMKRLRADLDRIFGDPQFVNAQWGVEVYSLDRSEKLYEKDVSRLLMPASNNKIITVAVALLRLKPDYQFKTQLWIDGPIVNNALQGNLIIAGFGDPSSSSRTQPGDIFQPLRSLVAQLKQRGIQTVSGDLIGDGGAFEEIMLGRGWAWDDLSEAYAAPVSALQFNENLIWLELAPGMKTGDLASVRLEPLSEYLSVGNKVATGAEGAAIHIEITRSHSDENVSAFGVVPLKAPVTRRAVAVQHPVRYYLSALKHVLATEEIDASNCSIKDTRGISLQSASLLYTHLSAPLSEIIKPILKISQNLGAETLTRTMGLELRGEGSFSKGKEVVEETLSQLGIDPESYSYADGSGLSRLNLASADMLVRLLRSMYGHPYFPYFHDALPVAGLDGTLAGRMKGTKAENNAHAKTGSITNVSAISGYVKTLDGEMLAFSMIANNFIGPKSRADMLQDKALERLARFSRK